MLMMQMGFCCGAETELPWYALGDMMTQIPLLLESRNYSSNSSDTQTPNEIL